jgi:hypothetical protein
VKKRFVPSLALSFLCVAVVVYIFYPTDEKRVRKIISNSEEAIISEDIDRLMEFVSYNYRDDYGNSYLLLKKRMQSVFGRLDDVEIERSIVKISVMDSDAEAELSVRVSVSEGEDRVYIIGDAGMSQSIKVFLKKSPYKWLITEVEGMFNAEIYY